MIGHMRHGSPPRLLALQSIPSPNRRESLPTPSAGVRITPTIATHNLQKSLKGRAPRGGSRDSTKARTDPPSGGGRRAFVQAGDAHGAARGHVPLALGRSVHPRVPVLRRAGDHGPPLLPLSRAGRLPTPG